MCGTTAAAYRSVSPESIVNATKDIQYETCDLLPVSITWPAFYVKILGLWWLFTVYARYSVSPTQINYLLLKQLTTSYTQFIYNVLSLHCLSKQTCQEMDTNVTVRQN